MITVSPHPTELFGMRASVNGLTVFLDNFAIIGLAKGHPDRRRRFIAILNRGVDVLFSVSNAAELSGPQGDSFITIREFLDEIGGWPTQARFWLEWESGELIEPTSE